MADANQNRNSDVTSKQLGCNTKCYQIAKATTTDNDLETVPKTRVRELINHFNGNQGKQLTHDVHKSPNLDVMSQYSQKSQGSGYSKALSWHENTIETPKLEASCSESLKAVSSKDDNSVSLFGKTWNLQESEDGSAHEYFSRTTIARRKSGTRITIDIFFGQEAVSSAINVIGSRVQTDIPNSRILTEFEQRNQLAALKKQNLNSRSTANGNENN